MTFRPDPPRSQSVTVSGTLFHASGPWGTNRPMRRTAAVNFLVREPPVGLAPGNEHQLGGTSIDGDGNFSIGALAMFIPPNVTSIEEFLRIEYFPTGDTQDITLEGVPWGFGTSQTVGPFRFNWMPPGQLAQIDGRLFEDTRGFADQLARLLMDAQPKPYSARTGRIVLQWEPREREDYTRAQNLFKDLRQLEIHQDFPVRLVKEVEGIPILRTNMKTTSDALLNYLFKISKFQPHQIERGTMLATLIKAIAKSLKWIVEDPVSDPMPDMAAASGLIYIAGRMAKDQGKMSSLNYGTRPVSWAVSGINTVEMSVGR